MPAEYTVLRSGTTARAQIEEQRSVFLCELSRVTDEREARERIALARSEHRQARHHCSAFLLGPGRETRRSSDDGEPSGTAGSPMLDVLTNHPGPRGIADLSDIVAVVTRWFGGILLGTGGLARAYGAAVQAALESAELVTCARMRTLALDAPHDRAGRWEHELRTAGLRILPAEYGPRSVRVRIAVPDREEDVRKVMALTATISAGRVPEVIGSEWTDVS